MRNKMFLLSTPAMVLLFMGVAGATVFTVVITGLVVGDITLPTQVAFGTLKLQQDVIRQIIVVGSPLTQPITVNATCESPGSFSGSFNLPIGSTTPTVTFNNNGTTTLPGNITIGNITLGIRGISQGRVNCTLSIDATNMTNVTVFQGAFQ